MNVWGPFHAYSSAFAAAPSCGALHTKLLSANQENTTKCDVVPTRFDSESQLPLSSIVRKPSMAVLVASRPAPQRLTPLLAAVTRAWWLCTMRRPEV